MKTELTALPSTEQSFGAMSWQKKTLEGIKTVGTVLGYGLCGAIDGVGAYLLYNSKSMPSVKGFCVSAGVGAALAIGARFGLPDQFKPLAKLIPYSSLGVAAGATALGAVFQSAEVGMFVGGAVATVMGAGVEAEKIKETPNPKNPEALSTRVSNRPHFGGFKKSGESYTKG